MAYQGRATVFAQSGRLKRAWFPSGTTRTSSAMEHQEVLEAVRGLRRRRYSPAEIARALGLSKAEAARLVRVVARERDSASTAIAAGVTNDRAAGSEVQCWVSPGWRHGLRIEGHADWPDDAGAPTEASDSGVALVLVCRAGRAEPPVGVQLPGRHVVPRGEERAGAEADGQARFRCAQADVFRSVGVAGHSDSGRTRPAPRARGGRVRAAPRLRAPSGLQAGAPDVGSMGGTGPITFGRDGKPYYVNGPYEDPKRVLARLERTVGRGGFHYMVSLDELGGLDGDYQYTVSVTDRDELGDAA